MNMNPDRYGSLDGQLDGLNNNNGDHHAAKGPEMTHLNSLQTASSQSLFRIIHKILDDSIANRKDEPEIVACLLKKLVLMIEQRSLQQAEDFRKQNDVFKTREENYQLKMSVLKTIVTGSNEEKEVLLNQLRSIKKKEDESQAIILSLQDDLFKEVSHRLDLDKEMEVLKQQLNDKKVKEKELLDIRVDMEKEMEVLKQQSKEMKKVEEERARLMKLHEEEMAYMKTKHAKEETEAKEKLNSKLDRLAKRMQSVNIL